MSLDCAHPLEYIAIVPDENDRAWIRCACGHRVKIDNVVFDYADLDACTLHAPAPVTLQSQNDANEQSRTNADDNEQLVEAYKREVDEVCYGLSNRLAGVSNPLAPTTNPPKKGGLP